jgi:effector-binding domain-containing protein
MKKSTTLLLTSQFLAVIIFLMACNSSDKKITETKKDTLQPVRAVVAENKEPGEAVKPGIINILDTVATKSIVIYMKDSAKTFERISIKLAQIYGVKLADVLKKNKIQMAGAPMAWYKSQKAPYFFEAGVPVNKKPAKFPANVFVREINNDSVVVAHFYGPYNLLEQGYTAIKEWMKDEKKIANGAPYEIYVGDPFDKEGKPIDPYKVRTDIVFPHK